jgi:hypothetical protein
MFLPGGSATIRRRGYLLYVVLTLMVMAAAFVFSLTRFRRGAVEQLSRTIEQHRLVAIGQSGANEILAIIRSEANDPRGFQSPTHFGGMFRAVSRAPDTDRPRQKAFVAERDFPPGTLPATEEIAEQVLPGQLDIRGRVQVCFNFRIKSAAKEFPGFSGQIETVVQVSSRRDPRNMVEVKERRDVILIYMRDFFDKYVLYVKNHSPDYNSPEQRLILEGLPVAGTSRAYIGNRFGPKPGDVAGAGDPQVHFDLNMQDEAKLLPVVLDKGLGITGGGGTTMGVKDATANGASQGKFFWTSGPRPFKDICARGGFSDADFYNVPSLQQQYQRSILEPARKALKALGGVPQYILTDWAEAGGVYGASKVFQQVIAECMGAWKYHFGYTDAGSIWQGTSFQPLAQMLHYSGLAKYPGRAGGLNPPKGKSGRMALLFGEQCDKPVLIEGNAFLRFFKIALLDEFEITFNIQELPFHFGQRPIPLAVSFPGDPPDFQNREVAIEGQEKVLMSRAVDTVPVNGLFYDGVKPLPDGLKGGPETAFPCLRPAAFSHLYKTPQEFRDDRIVEIGGQKVLNVDGNLLIERGDLRLDDIHAFTGNGMIWINFEGNVFLGSLRRYQPHDLLKIFVQDGDIIIQSDDPTVRIEASLMASRFSSKAAGDPANVNNMGKLICSQRCVEILGNLVVDYLFLNHPTLGIPKGKHLKIVHDPVLFGTTGQDFFRASVGRVRSAFTINPEYGSRIIK